MSEPNEQQPSVAELAERLDRHASNWEHLTREDAQRIAALLRAGEPTRQALFRYGEHTYECYHMSSHADAECICGLDAALQAARAVEL